MNSVVGSTGLSPNQILYGQSTWTRLDLLSTTDKCKHITKKEQRTLFRKKAMDAIDFANIKTKLRYDGKHKPLELKVEEKAYLWLHQRYTLLEAPNKKLSRQRVGLFKIIKKVDKLAYKLKLLPLMRIYPVVSIAQLEPAKGLDLYKWTRPNHPRLVSMEETREKASDNGTNLSNSYKVEQIVGKRVRRYSKSKPRTKYQVKWMGWRPEWNEWISEEDCTGATRLVDEFKNCQTGL